jgi:hypothetical protein
VIFKTKKTKALWTVLALAAFLAPGDDGKNYKLIPLSTLDFEIVETVCRPMMSPGAVLTFEKSRNAVLIYDSPEVIKKVEDFIKAADKEPVNIRIEITSSGSSGADSLRAGVKKPQPIVIRDGKVVSQGGKIQPDLSYKTTTGSSSVSQFLVTMSGRPATLWAGKTVVDPVLARQWLTPETVILQDGKTTVIPPMPVIKTANIGASLKILPHLRENGLIDVEVYPELSWIEGKGRKQAVKVQSLSTKVTVAPGASIDIGGIMASKKESYLNLLGPDFFRKEDGSDMWTSRLKASLISPSGVAR